MYFFRRQGRQVLDLRGNLILSHNADLVRARVKSSAPRFVQNGDYVLNLKAPGYYSFLRRVRATFATIRFIWGDSKALTAEAIEAENK